MAPRGTFVPDGGGGGLVDNRIVQVYYSGPWLPRDENPRR